VSTSSGEVERVLSALVARREPLAARLAGGADSRWKLRLVDPMRQYILVEPLSGGSAIPALLECQQVTFVAEFGGMHIEFPASDPVPVTEEGTRAVRMSFPKSPSAASSARIRARRCRWICPCTARFPPEPGWRWKDRSWTSAMAAWGSSCAAPTSFRRRAR